jgi:dCMP deaminase
MNWVEYFLGVAEQVKLKSKDKNTKIGAVIVGEDNEILSTGYNSFPRGLNDDIEFRQLRPQKYFYMVHAEINSIVNAARTGVSIKNSTIFLTCGVPCADCTKGIINSGIKKVYCREICTTSNKEKWDEHQKISLEMLNECGVEVIYY